MNPLALLLMSLVLGQTADSPKASAAGPRYQNAPASNPIELPASNGVGSADPGLPSLPRTSPSAASQIPGQRGGTGFPSSRKSGEIAPVASAVAGERGPIDRNYDAEDSTMPAITLPGREPGDNVGANPFPAPNTGNPLRGNAAEIQLPQSPAANSAIAESGVDESAVAEERLNSDEGALELQPRQFVPSRPGSTFVPAVIDESVKPAAAVGDGPLVPVQPPENENTAERLLREAFTPPEIHSLSGQPVTLDELLATQESVGERHATLVQTYWQLCTAVSQYHWALEEQQILENAIAGRQIPRVTNADVLALRAKTAEAKANTVDAQLRLAAMRPAVSSTELPLPVDRPVVASYRTYYDSLFASRTQAELAARHAKRLHQTLPLRREAVKAYADAVAAAEENANPNNYVMQGGQLDLMGLAKSIRDLSTQRKAFMSAVQTYNQSIADYALLAASPGTSASGLLPMLIKVKPRSQDTVAEAFVTPQPAIPAEIQVGATQVISPDGGTFVTGPVTAAPTENSSGVPTGVIQAGAEEPIGENSMPAANTGQKQMRSVLVRSGKLP